MVITTVEIYISVAREVEAEKLKEKLKVKWGHAFAQCGVLTQTRGPTLPL